MKLVKILYERRIDNIDYIYLTKEASSEVSLVLYKAALIRLGQADEITYWLKAIYEKHGNTQCSSSVVRYEKIANLRCIQFYEYKIEEKNKLKG